MRVRSVATIGGVLADADYASDPPACSLALGARVELASPGGTRVLGVDELILGHYDDRDRARRADRARAHPAAAARRPT